MIEQPAARNELPDSPAAARREHGTTLVELMIGIAIGMLVLGALAALFAQTGNARSEIDRAGQQIENGRFALELLREDLHQAGYFGGFTGGTRRVVGACVPRSGVLLSAAALGWQDSPPLTPMPIHGYAGGDTPAGETCLSNQQPGTDALVVRSVEPVTTTVAAANASSFDNDYFIQTSACADPGIDAVDRPFVIAAGGAGAVSRFSLHQKDCAAVAPLHKLIVRAWYVGRCSVCSSPADSIPSLRLVELTGAAASSASVVEGIESMRVEYLLDTDHDGEIDATRRCKAGVDPCSETDWSDVIAVQVRLLSRSLSPSPGYVDNKAYDMGLAGIIPARNDGYRRHLFGALVTAYNLAGQREH